MSVSVYMDDIIIASNDPGQLALLLSEIRPISESSKFPLNSSKEEGPAETITAFNIELSKNVLKLTEERLEQFKEDYAAAVSSNVQGGIVGYVSTVNSEQASEIEDSS